MAQPGFRQERSAQMDMLRSVKEGRRVAHVWHSPQFEGVEMAIQYRWPEVEVGPDDHGLPSAFAEDVELEYAGTMSRERAAKKLVDMRLAEQAVQAG